MAHIGVFHEFGGNFKGSPKKRGGDSILSLVVEFEIWTNPNWTNMRKSNWDHFPTKSGWK